jgi:predicted PurR-regulated permease PerM
MTATPMINLDIKPAPETEEPQRKWNLREIATSAAVVMAVAIVFAAMVAIVWIASKGFIIIFGGILFAVLLDAGARTLGYIVPWRRRVRLMVVFVALAILLTAALTFGGAILVAQANNFFSAMADLLKQADQILQTGRLGFIPAGTSITKLLPDGSTLFGGATTIATSAFEAIVLATAVLFLGAFFAWEPAIYKSIVLSILPKARRQRVNAVLDLCALTMREWLVGQGVSMIAIFIFSLVALMLVGMPYPVLLAVQAGLLTFVPTLGPFVAGVIIILAGLSHSVVMAAYGLGTYLIIQFLETHLVTPLVQERTVRLPPAATLGLQIVAGMLFGIPGIIFAVPATAAGRTLIQELYVDDYLGGGWYAPRRRHDSRLQRLLDRLLGEADDL